MYCKVRQRRGETEEKEPDRNYFVTGNSYLVFLWLTYAHHQVRTCNDLKDIIGRYNQLQIERLAILHITARDNNKKMTNCLTVYYWLAC